MSERAVIALVGLRCVGKSSVGRALARELGLGFVDLDDAIAWADSEGCCAQHIPTVAHIVETQGWEGFRDLESRELERVLAAGERLVLATGGGVVERARNRELLRAKARVVWLRDSLDVLALRLRQAEDRPSLTGLAPDLELAQVAARREPLYREVAACEVEVGDADVEAVTRRVRETLARG
jgi:shikimate kinase